MHRYQAALATALLFTLEAVQAAGLGSYEVQSALGQPLRMVVQVTTRADEVIEPGCFKLNPYTVANDGLPQLTGAQVTLETRGNLQRLIITSSRAILDPIVRVSIEVGCNTTLRRDLTLLLDPLPAIETPAQTTEPVGPAGVSVTPATRPAAITADDAARSSAGSLSASNSAADRETAAGQQSDAAAVTQRPTAAPPVAAAARAPRAATETRRSEPRPAPQRVPRAIERRTTAQPRARLAQPAPQAPRDRLTISASGPPPDSYVGAPISPRLTLSTSLADRSGQPPLSEASLAILRQKQARLKAAPTEEDIPSMEAELVVLQKRTAEVRSQLDAVMAQLAALRESPGAAGSAGTPAVQPPAPASAVAATPVSSLPPEPPGGRWSLSDPRLLLAAVLGGTLLLLLIGFALWLRRERSDSRYATRWNKSPYVPVTAPPASAPRATPDAGGGSFQRAAANAERSPLPESYAFPPFSTAHAARDLGVSDLAQATEKASVFVTLGRPEQAIDVLLDHIDHEPKPSPMAWLMLLDLYRQTDRRSDFDDISHRFHLEFNAATPEWVQTSPSHDVGLAAVPRIVEQIRDHWPNQEARAQIEELLYDNRGGSRIGFSLAAFRDLLLLHGIIDDHLLLLEAAALDPAKGKESLAPPAPPPHLAQIWHGVTAAQNGNAPAAPQPAALQLDMGLLSSSPERCALETGYPIMAEAIMTRWGKPGLANYLGNLIRATNENHGPSMTVETIGELIMLHGVAQELGDPEPGFSLG